MCSWECGELKHNQSITLVFSFLFHFPPLPISHFSSSIACNVLISLRLFNYIELTLFSHATHANSTKNKKNNNIKLRWYGWWWKIVICVLIKINWIEMDKRKRRRKSIDSFMQASQTFWIKFWLERNFKD